MFKINKLRNVNTKFGKKKKECIHLRKNLLKKIEKILEKKYYALIFRTRNSMFMFTCYFQIQEVEK